MRDSASPITKVSDKLRTSQLIGSSVTFPATRIGSPFKAINFCCTSGTVRKYIVLPVAPENIRYATDVTITTTPMDNFTCCLDMSSILPRRHCHLLLNAMTNSTCMRLVREALTFKFPHLLQYCTVDMLNSIAGERSRVDSAQALDDRCLTFWNIDWNVMMPFKIGHVAHYFGPL